LNVWATKEFSVSALGGTFGPPGFDTATSPRAKSLFEATDHLGGGFERGLEVGIVDLLDVLIARWVLEAGGRSSAIDTRHCDRPANSIKD
jgi:hypothetical protein